MQQTSATCEPREQAPPQLSEILSTLSFALDLTEGAVPGHAVRSCLLALRIAEALRLGSRERVRLYYAALLKDVGCSSNAARMCQIIGGDDRAMKAGVKLEDWTRPHQVKLSVLKLMWTQVLPGDSALRKIRRMVSLAASQHENNKAMIQLRCDRGASIVRKIGLDHETSSAVLHLDEHWNGSGYPDSLTGHQIPLLSRILCVAQHLDAFCGETGPLNAVKVMVERSGQWFDPEIVKATVALDRAGALWQHCLPSDDSAGAHHAVLQAEPGAGGKLEAGSIDRICEAFAEVVDAKSPFTFRHSVGVKDAAMMIGKSLGLAPERMQMLRRAALLHDIGKLSVSNMILDKPGHLDENEFRVVKRHAALTREILSRMPALDEISVIAGEHHEKLDGTGYPFGLKAEHLSLEARLIAVADVYGALSEDRPYRPRLDPEEIFRIMKKDVPGKLDGECFEALRAVWPQASRPVDPINTDWSSVSGQSDCLACGTDRVTVTSAAAATVADAVVREAASRNSTLPPQIAR
jgi:putative nucleotidyltransferase with HDIG domain